MNVCDIEVADFVVWSEKDIVIERILRDRAFFEAECEKIEPFFTYGVLPELVGKWYTW